MTKAIKKLLRFLPSTLTLPDPSHFISEAEVQPWLTEVSKLNHKLHTEVMSAWKDKVFEQVIENCERATNRETSDPRTFWKKASGLLYKTKQSSPQLTVDIEIPTQGNPLQRVDRPHEANRRLTDFGKVHSRNVTQ